MEKYPFLETSAFVVIGVLGIKLMLSLLEHFAPNTPISQFLGSHAADWGFSAVTLCIFFHSYSIPTIYPEKKVNIFAFILFRYKTM
jgi:predicted tellurium resistance membrane protein TerC